MGNSWKNFKDSLGTSQDGYFWQLQSNNNKMQGVACGEKDFFPQMKKNKKLSFKIVGHTRRNYSAIIGLSTRTNISMP